MVNLKSEKGGVTIYVLMTMLILIITLVAIYISLTNKQITQLEVAEQIKTTYEKDINNIDEIYNELISNENTISADSKKVYHLQDYDYTGGVQIFTVPETGTYKFELWGASGGDIDTYTGGNGAYVTGEIDLTQGTNLYLYVGGQGSNSTVGGYNGGSNISEDQELFGCSGGGATDIRIDYGTWTYTNWDDEQGLKNRIMVAAGGGGANNRNKYPIMGDISYRFGVGNGGAGGELIGEDGVSTDYWTVDGSISYNQHGIGYGGKQTSGGDYILYDEQNNIVESILTGGFGKTIYNGHIQSGGGSGYYTGGMGGHGGAGGGSSFISGHTGCNAIDANGTHTNQANHFSGYVFRNSQMISGSKSMPNPRGNDEVTGNDGNGYIKVYIVK